MGRTPKEIKKRPADLAEHARTVLEDSLPPQSAKQYNAEWEKFCAYNKIKATRKQKPSCEMFTSYFASLNDAGMAPASIWTAYSKLNGILRTRYAGKLQDWPQLTTLLKSYAAGSTTKQSSIFTSGEMNRFVSEESDDTYHLVRQCYAAVGYTGGLRAVEAHGLKYGNVVDLSDSHDGELIFKVTFRRGKVRGAEEKNDFYIMGEYATAVKQCRDSLAAFNKVPRDSEPFFLTGVSGLGWRKSVVGIHTLYAIPKYQADHLKLPNAATYTGHCYRRSAAQYLVDSGLSTEGMKRNFGWKSESMVNRYTARSSRAQREVSSLFVRQPGLSVAPSPLEVPTQVSPSSAVVPTQVSPSPAVVPTQVSPSPAVVPTQVHKVEISITVKNS